MSKQFEEWWIEEAERDERAIYLAMSAWDAAVVNSKLTPEGYVLVPVEPTERMIDFAVNKTAIGSLAVESIYKAMIHAAQEQE